MIILRYLLFPFAVLFGWITTVRNFLYDTKILKSYSFDVPVIVVGNLSLGGTGKTPQIEYLIRLLSPNYKLATLSRGYKRKSKGFILANSNATAEILGDEPFQIHQKFPQIQVAVDADRKNGIENLLSLKDRPEVILLDDAFQHRRVKAGFYILLSAYDDLFFNDFILPTGNLRESRSGVKRADVIIITKCPKDLSEITQKEIKAKIGVEAPVFFSYIDYDDLVYNQNESKKLSEVMSLGKIVVAGIAKPEPFFKHLNAVNDECLVFPDHHFFTANDIQQIEDKAKNKIIITTEKDFVRLSNQNLKAPIYYLPINSSFLSKSEELDNKIKNYVGSSSRNR
ncbi:tetraacyldisaccharide 4'-kinase [Flavobacterium sp.]|jgi:tetraacyldisaccharide 4'-kinase|uniref:tetraacyldisaccharide 4'-kinase n=1 Tax=Flavobacterium sp. TaxID=239 RepID=UPI0037C0F8A7